MLHSYAISPDALSHILSDPERSVHFLGSIGLGSPRVFLEFPKEWNTLAQSACCKSSMAATPKFQIALTEFLKKLLSDGVIRRQGDSVSKDNWHDAIEKVYAVEPFHAVLCASKALQIPTVDVKKPDWQTNQYWDVPNTLSVECQPKYIVKNVSSMVLNSVNVTWVAPYFKSDFTAHLGVLSQLKSTLRARVTEIEKFRIIAAYGEKNPTLEFVKATFSHDLELCELLKKNAFEIVWVEPKNAHIRLHNRYWISSFGVLFSGDEPRNGSDQTIDDWSVLSRQGAIDKMALYNYDFDKHWAVRQRYSL